jgi:hypothetical protein
MAETMNLINQPKCFTADEIEQLKIEIKDNFPDLTDEDRTRILDYIDAKLYWNT